MDNNPKMNVFFKAAFVCGCIGAGLLTISMVFATISMIDMKEPSKTEIYMDEVVDVNADRIILSNGDVIFAHDINAFTWKIGQTYEIKVETYSDRFGYVKPNVITEVKET